MIQKTTKEIVDLLNESDMDIECIINEALNSYLPKIFHSCPYTEDVCTKKQCVECSVFKCKTVE